VKEEVKGPVDVEVDKTALEDAMSSENPPASVDKNSLQASPQIPPRELESRITPEIIDGSLVMPPVLAIDQSPATFPAPALDMGQSSAVLPDNNALSGTSDISLDVSGYANAPYKPPSPKSTTPIHEFSSTTVHLADNDNLLDTRRRKLFYTTASSFLPSHVAPCV
jgi:hypothetical protein